MPKQKKSSNITAPHVWSDNKVPSALPARVPAGAAVIIMAAVLVYLPFLGGGFIWDDDDYLTNNNIIKSSDGLYRFWFTSTPTDYYPVSNTTLWLEWRLWEMNPTGYRASNLVLHIIEALLIWAVLRELSITGAYLAALIFALHPVNVESVVWIAQRKDMLAMLFFLLSVFCFLKGEKPAAPQDHGHRIGSPVAPCPGSLFYWSSLLTFVMGMLSKGSIAMLPVLLLGIVWWREKKGTVPFKTRGTVPFFLRAAPFFLVAAALTAVHVWFQTHGSGNVIRSAGFAERLLGAGGTVWFYLYKALLPLNLIFVYPLWRIQTSDVLWYLPLLAALAVTIVLWRYRESWGRPLFFAWGFFCVALVPVMGFTDVYFLKYSLVADHYQHAAIIGVITLAAAGLSHWHKRMMRPATIVAAAMVSVLMCLTWQQSRMYYDIQSLYQITIDGNPECWLAHNNLGVLMVKQGRLNEAFEHYDKALSIEPDNAKTHNNLGNALLKVDRLKEAIGHYQEAIKASPYFAKARYNLGYALLNTGQSQESIEHFEQAIRLDPNLPEAQNTLGNALNNIGRPQEAIEHYRQAIRLKPDYVEAHNNLGVALMNTGRSEEAIDYYRQQVLRLDPNLATGYFNLALAYSRMQRSSEAVAAARKALELARSQGQAAQCKQIEDWLKSYATQSLQ